MKTHALLFIGFLFCFFDSAHTACTAVFVCPAGGTGHEFQYYGCSAEGFVGPSSVVMADDTMIVSTANNQRVWGNARVDLGGPTMCGLSSLSQDCIKSSFYAEFGRPENGWCETVYCKLAGQKPFFAVSSNTAIVPPVCSNCVSTTTPPANPCNPITSTPPQSVISMVEANALLEKFNMTFV